MARVEPFWEPKGSGNWADGVQANVSSLLSGGMFGYAPHLEGWVNAKPYTSRPLRIYLMEAPLVFRLFPDGGTSAIAMLRALFETVAHRITGFEYQLQVSSDGSMKLGGAGQSYNVPTNVTESDIKINLSVFEKEGMPVFRALSQWIRMGIMDPATKHAAILTMNTSGRGTYDSMPDMWSCSLLAVQMDAVGQKVVQSWYCFNVWPENTGDNTAEKDLENPSQVRELTIPFNCNYIYGPGSDFLAQKMADTMSMVGANVYHRGPIINGIQALVQSAPTSYASSIRNIASKQYR